MSCSAPINITRSSVIGNCDLKCAYSFNYNSSTCVITNRGNYLSFAYDKSSSPPVIYNSSNYDVTEMRLYTPSLHSFNGAKVDCEFIIVHNSPSGGASLLVCLAVNANNTSSSSSANFFKTVIETAASNANADGETAVVQLNQFSLNDIVKKSAAYYSYTATEPYQPCSSVNVDYVVFDPVAHSLDITPDTLTSLQTIIDASPYDVKESGINLFYNEKGALSGIDNGEIYIDCQPVNTSDETTDIVTDYGGTLTFNDLMKNPFVQLFLGVILFLCILYVIKGVYFYIVPSSSLAASLPFTPLKI